MDIKDLNFETSTDEKDLVTLKITISKDAYDKELEKQIEYYKPRVNVKGFRVGHAPNNIILSRFRDALEGATNEVLIEEAWNTYHDEKNVKALGTPKLLNLEKKDDGLHLDYEYYPIPEFELPDLSSINVEKNKYTVDDTVVEEAYKLSLQRFSHFEESDLKSEIGDRVQVKIEFDDDENKKYDKELTVVASDDENESIFSRNAVGVKKDDKKLLKTYVDGREATLMMNILKVEKPDMKDDSNEEDRQKVKESLKEHLIKRAEERANSELINDTLFNKLIELVNITLPKGYFEEQLEISLNEFDRSMSSRGMSKTDFLISVAKTDEDIKKEYEENVRKQISFDMIMAKLSDTYKDSITVNEEKAKEYANRMYQYQSYMGLAKLPKDEQQNIINYIMRDAHTRATSEAIMDYVKDHVNVSEKDAAKFEPDETDVWGGY
ncbi:trigger factor [Brachyspira hampsonii]|uniref:trigger factor n=1 Tax=Brachyspira hampsonii TaxID=1287055 RepID=UPI001CA4E92C|nr:trigger factor [Brachyspira hampsonii]MBW5390694.1 trigger factor [Brachyspira hampsonii]